MWVSGGELRAIRAGCGQRRRKTLRAIDETILRGDRIDSTFLRLLDRLPDAERYETDAYGVHGCLHASEQV